MNDINKIKSKKTKILGPYRPIIVIFQKGSILFWNSNRKENVKEKTKNILKE